MQVHFKSIKNLEHYALWGFMFLFVFDYHFWEDNWLEAIGMTSMELLFYVLVFYFNYRIAIPIFLEKGQRLSYLVVLIIFLLIYVFVINVSGLVDQFYEGSFWRNTLSMTINFVLFWLISTLYWYYGRLQKERENQLNLKAEKLETELRFLKNQISPHFIFNTLNNIYSLVQQGHQNAAPMLAQLAVILRYILYDSSKPSVPLQKELITIQEYIKLQLYRKPKSTNVDFYQEGDINDLKIAPLILLNFVENCFKHSDIDTSENAWIKISCSVYNKELEFITENSKGKKTQVEEGGIGNKNIQRQLALNYKEQYTLTIEDEEEIYKTQLILNL